MSKHAFTLSKLSVFLSFARAMVQGFNPLHRALRLSLSLSLSRSRNLGSLVLPRFTKEGVETNVGLPPSLLIRTARHKQQAAHKPHFLWW